MDLLQSIENYLIENILESIGESLSYQKIKMGIFILLNIISISLFIFMIYRILFILKNETKLKNLIDKYIISSTMDKKGKITAVSSAFCEISGYSKEELIGKSYSLICHPDMGTEYFKNILQTIKNENSYNGVIKNRKKNSDYYWVNLHIEPVFNSKKKIDSYFAIRLDVTDKINLENEIEKNRQKDKQLLEQSRLVQMGEMISMIAHQWRQPLTAISATSAALELKATLNNLDNQTIIRNAQNISEYSQHLSATINDFRDFFKQHKNKRESSFELLVQAVFGIVQTSIENKNISLTYTNTSDNKLFTYTNELKQVILNLIKNSEDILLEKSVKEPYINIYTYTKNSCEILEVKDNGGGIDRDIIDKIFDPYFSTKDEKNGTGLGLYMSKIIVEEHCQGTLSVQNTEDGAIFTISQPLS